MYLTRCKKGHALRAAFEGMEFARLPASMKTLLICHHDDMLDRIGVARWLASFSELAGVVEIREPGGRVWRRIRREVRRVGLLRFLDVLAYRVYERLALARSDAAWQAGVLERLCTTYPPLPERTPVLVTPSPNTPAAAAFIRSCGPDIILARCKSLLSKDVFAIPAGGTFVLHPGICPEYRNAHGCFWALASGDLDKVGATLLQVDQGVDTGPVYGYFGYAFDEVAESPSSLSRWDRTLSIPDSTKSLPEFPLTTSMDGCSRARPRASRIDTSRRASATWGQPWLTKYLRWKYRARRRRREGAIAAVP